MLQDGDVRWLAGPVSILLASCDAERRPSLAIGLAVHVAPDRVSIVVLDTTSAQLVADVRAGRGIAVSFTHSASTRSLQVKARAAVVRAPQPAETASLDAYAAMLAREFAANGQPAEYGHAFLVRAPGTLVAIDVPVEEVFD